MHRGKVAAIFGASGGIGAALCEALAADGVARIYAGSRAGTCPTKPGLIPFSFDLTDEASISAAAKQMAGDSPDLIIVTTGVLTLPDGAGENAIEPERSYRHLDAAAIEAAFRLNTIGPALIAKHMLPLLPREGRSVFAALSARVGSIGDNQIGGWHSYRASKAALNMLIRNFAIELARTHKQAVVAGLHPGTVDTALSKPFQRSLPEGQLTSAHGAATRMLTVLDGLGPQDSGGVFDWAGKRLPD